jgi:flagellar M-ring protein FliF
VAAAVAAVTTRLGALSRPAKIFIATSTALAILFASFLFYREAHETYAVLFTQLEPDDAAGIVAKLKELKASYKIEAGGTTIEVPEGKVAELRMDLVSAGLPRGGGVGFESFDKMRLGSTEFEQQVLYRRALEGELARTIGSLGVVQSARVHLVLPEKSVFVARREPASASIMLHLRGGRSLGPSEVQSIVNLTAAAVPGLTPDHVAVVSTDGQMLKKPRTGGQAGDASDSDEEQANERRVIEAQLEDRARSMLEKVVGPGHVDVRVTAELDGARVEHTEDHYDQSKTALRSEELTRERSGAMIDDTVAGVPGAESNLPAGAAPAAPTAPATAAASAAASASAAPGLLAVAPPKTPLAVPSRQGEGPFRESHTRNFEVDHVSDRRTMGPGALKRIGVAVILDGVSRLEGGKLVSVARDPAELERFTTLVRSAVGANDARGDSITVQSVPFEETAAAAKEPSEIPAAVPLATRSLRAYAPAAAVAVLLLLVAGVAIARRRLAPRPEVASALLPPTVEAARLDAGAAPLDLRARAVERATQDPATAALVLRFWLGTTDSELKA